MEVLTPGFTGASTRVKFHLQDLESRFGDWT